jgi:hypothetical protein
MAPGINPDGHKSPPSGRQPISSGVVITTNTLERIRAALVVKIEEQLYQLELEVISEALTHRGYGDLMSQVLESPALYVVESPRSGSSEAPRHQVERLEDVTSLAPESAFDEVESKVDCTCTDARLQEQLADLAVGETFQRLSGKKALVEVTRINDEGLWVRPQVRWNGRVRNHVEPTELDSFFNDYRLVSKEGH